MSDSTDSTHPIAMTHEEQIFALREEIEEQRRTIADLRNDALRFRALMSSHIMSASVADIEGHPVALNPGWEKMWQIPREPFLKMRYCVLEDPQLIASGAMEYLNRAFRDGQEVVQPPIAYNPQNTRGVETGNAQEWITAVTIPVFDEEKRQIEVLMIQYASADAATLQKQHRELFTAQAELEASLREKNQELEARLLQIEEQRNAIQALSAPVLRVQKSVLVVPLVGIVDDTRAARILETLLESVVEQQARQVIVDVTGLASMDEGAANHLSQMAKAVKLIGAECILAGISPGIARTLLELGVELSDLRTTSSLADALTQVTRTRRA